MANARTMRAIEKIARRPGRTLGWLVLAWLPVLTATILWAGQALGNAPLCDGLLGKEQDCADARDLGQDVAVAALVIEAVGFFASLGAWFAALATNRRKRVLANEAAPLLARAKDLFSRGELEEAPYVSLRDRCEAIVLQTHPAFGRWRLGRTAVWIGGLLAPLALLFTAWVFMIGSYETTLCAAEGCSPLHMTGITALLFVLGISAAIAGLCAIVGIPAGWRGQSRAWGELQAELLALKAAEHDLLVQANSKSRAGDSATRPSRSTSRLAGR